MRVVIPAFIFLIALFLLPLVVRAAPGQDRVLLVPGIGGSVLLADGQQVWTTVLGQNSKLQALRAPYNATCACFAGPRVEPLPGLAGIYSLNPSIHWTPYFGDWVEYFAPVIDMLQLAGYQPGVDLFAMPYDWRRAPDDVRLQHELAAALASPGRPWKIVAHSMGGLLVQVARQLGAQADLFALGTPWYGVGGRIHGAFLWGYNFENPLFSDMVLARDIALLSPSPYWLLPQPELAPRPQLYNESEAVMLGELMQGEPLWRGDRIRRHNWYFTQPTVLLGNGGLPTQHDLNVTSRTVATWIAGDGTVPLQSAMATGVRVDSRNIKRIPLDSQIDHIELLHDVKVINHLAVWLDLPLRDWSNWRIDLDGRYAPSDGCPRGWHLHEARRCRRQRAA